MGCKISNQKGIVYGHLISNKSNYWNSKDKIFTIAKQNTVHVFPLKRALMASFAMFPTVFKTYEKHYRRFCSKELPKRHF